MSGENNNGGAKRQDKPKGLIYHNSFVLAISFVMALVLWFVMAMRNADTNFLVADVPIEVQFSERAEGEGLRVFSMSYEEADLEISGSSLITNRLTADDFHVTVTLDPVSTKLTGNTVQRETIPLQATKNAAMADYNIESINPSEITVVYDRYKEVTFDLATDEINYSVSGDFMADQVSLSQSTVTVSGPESSVNKISRAAVTADYTDPLKETASFQGAVTLYDYENQPIDTSDDSTLFLDLDVKTVDVTVPILATKTVDLVPTNLVRKPESFPSSRIDVEPRQITIAGSEDALANIESVELDTPIDFATLDTSGPNEFVMDILLPAGVKNIGSAGEEGTDQATVKVNLNAYDKVILTVPPENILFLNGSPDKEVTLENQGLNVSVVGPGAQVSRLVGSELVATVDLTNYNSQVGRMQAAATVTVAGDSADSCWAVGSYTVTLSIEDASSSSSG